MFRNIKTVVQKFSFLQVQKFLASLRNGITWKPMSKTNIIIEQINVCHLELILQVKYHFYICLVTFNLSPKGNICAVTFRATV